MSGLIVGISAARYYCAEVATGLMDFRKILGPFDSPEAAIDNSVLIMDALQDEDRKARHGWHGHTPADQGRGDVGTFWACGVSGAPDAAALCYVGGPHRSPAEAWADLIEEDICGASLPEPMWDIQANFVGQVVGVVDTMLDGSPRIVVIERSHWFPRQPIKGTYSITSWNGDGLQVEMTWTITQIKRNRIKED